MFRMPLLSGINVIPAAERMAAETAAKDKRLAALVLAMGAVLLVIIIILIIFDRKKNKNWGSKKRTGLKISDRIYPPLYRFLISYPLTRSYLEKMAYRYRMISPGDTRLIARRTINACLISWGICFLTFLFIYMLNPRLITLITVTAAVFIIHAEVIGRMTKSFEIYILQEAQKLLLSVQHNFYVEYRVDDAIYRSRDRLCPDMRAAADQIYQLLLSEDKEEDLREYYENIPNKYLRAFVGQCVGVMERGDQVVDGKRLFISNLEKLYREMDIEIDKLQRLNLEFLGVTAVVVAPIFSMDFVKRFAISIKENMVSFYYGKEGFLLDIGLILAISVIYTVMRKSAEYSVYHPPNHRLLYRIDRIPVINKAMDNYCDKNASKLERLRRELRNNGSNMRSRHFVLRSMLIALLVFMISTAVIFYLHRVSKEQSLTAKRIDVESLTSAAKESNYEKMAELIETYTKSYVIPGENGKTEEIPATVGDMAEVLNKDGTFYNRLINEALAEEILRRINTYRGEYFSFIDLVICMVLSAAAYYLPKMLLKYSATVSRDAMEDEVNQFNALVCMLMYSDSMSVKQILEEMESFAVVFKQSLRSCINDYGAGDIPALLDLKEREPYEPFGRIIDNLIRCDDMPIRQAFHEVDVERDGYMARRKLANEKSIRKRVVRAYLLAAIPFLLLFAYGIIPPLVSAMSEINLMLKELERSPW